MTEFVHLHVHSEYSLLDGLSSCRELAERAAQLGMPALALTDHGAMYGAVQFYKACKAAGVKPIIGLEPHLARRGRQDRDARHDRKSYHLILLAQNDTGYRNLMRLATIAQLEGFYYKPRIDKEVLAEHADGLIALSGCGTSEVPRLIRAGQLDEARRTIAWYHDVFPGRYYLELQEHDIPEMTQVNRQLLAFAREFDLPVVATNDVHYVRREEASIHDVLLCIQTGKTSNEPERMRMDGDTYYLRSAEEMATLFSEVPQALANTLRIAEMCELELEFGRYHLPLFQVPEGYDAPSYLRHLCEEGLQRRYVVITPPIRERLDYELDIIHRMGFDTYFLIVWDLCRFAGEEGIWWNVRGSGASSIVAYSLGITNLEPLQHGLIFERFLSLGRVTMPDIDLDLPDDQRDQLIRYTIEKYGQEQVAQIITFGTMGAKASIRDVGRALDYPLPEVDRIARLVPAGPKVKLEQALREVPELREQYETQEHIRRLIDTARGVEGNVRHASTHAAGVILSDVPLVEYTPLHRPTRGGAGGEIGVVTQYAMEELEELGLLKIDFLGLSTLTIMRRACELIRQRHGVNLNLDSIPTDDPVTYDLLSRGDVMGVFQVEGAGMRRVLMKMQPTKFEHIIATISLFRPGPMEHIDDYIDRMHGRKPVKYRHPSLEPILKETYATIVYQEQIIRILTDIAGYTPGEADLVRRCISEDTLIVDADTGRVVKIKDVQPGTSVFALDDEYRLCPVQVEQKFDNGLKQVYRVTTKSKRTIELTANHPLLTVLGWRPLAELRVGDAIAVPWKMPVFGQRQPNPHKVKALAYLIGDGQCVQSDGYPVARFYNSNPEILQDYIETAEALGASTKTYSYPTTSVTTVTSAGRDGHSNPLVDLVRQFDLAHKAPDKRIPSSVFEYNRGTLALFIGTLWNTDGYIGENKIEYSSSSRRLIESLDHLLRRFGINAWQGERETTHKNHHRLVISDQNEIRRFADAFGVHLCSAHKQRLDTLMEQVNRRQQNQSKYQVPSEVLGLVHKAKVSSGLSWREARERVGAKKGTLSGGLSFQTHNRALSRHRLDKLGRAFEAPQLRHLARADILWDPITSIEPVGQKRVYDLAVPPHVNFVANDIVIHNSIGKKKKKALLDHRAKFVEGAVEHDGLPRDVAETIFDDIEYFARYGFNKAHASDYAVLTCQTAYLKAKYPVEYMAALLSVERHNIEKVGLLIAECRRMGIEVLPPDVNHSGIDFTIEELPDGRPAIRFGMGAIKNVGEGPVEALLAARRARGPFRDLDDFCRCVDLRQVNRRALESLIKVGALRPFGTRAQLLPIVERIIGLSAHLHRAQDVGQLSLFGEATGVRLAVEETLLPPLSQTPEVPQKNILAWEKDLVGVYISEHPLAQVLVRLQDVVTAYAGALSEEMNGQQVVVTGTVQRVRRHTTKKGDEMAFVTLEDLQGTCNVVVFPRVWSQTKSLWQPEHILVVSGKVDAGRQDEPNLLCDWVKTRDEVAVPTPPLPPPTGGGEGGGRTVRVTLTRSGEQTRDVQTLRQVHSLLVGHPGQDRFIIHLVGGAGRPVELAFPNDTTRYCPELVQALTAVLGPDAVHLSQSSGGKENENRYSNRRRRRSRIESLHQGVSLSGH